MDRPSGTSIRINTSVMSEELIMFALKYTSKHCCTITSGDAGNLKELPSLVAKKGHLCAGSFVVNAFADEVRVATPMTKATANVSNGKFMSVGAYFTYMKQAVSRGGDHRG